MSLLLGFLLFTATAFADDHLAVAEQILAKEPVADMGRTMIEIGTFFEGKPYVGGTLEQKGEESLVLNLDAFDCFTFNENVLALAFTLQQGGGLEDYKHNLQALRYRGGVIDGYPSRLHYTVDWAYDNVSQGFLKDVTAEIGGVPYEKTINFMTANRHYYDALKEDDAAWSRMKQIETAINERSYSYIPKEKVAALEAGIQDGDFIAITTKVEGLDVSHVGLAVRGEDGRVYMLHAGLKHKRVEVTDTPLADYLAGNKSQTGIMVFRPLKPNKS